GKFFEQAANVGQCRYLQFARLEERFFVGRDSPLCGFASDGDLKKVAASQEILNGSDSGRVRMSFQVSPLAKLAQQSFDCQKIHRFSKRDRRDSCQYVSRTQVQRKPFF